MAYIGKSPDGTGVRSRFYYTQSSGGGTSVSGSSDDGTTLAFSDGAYVDVYLNGVLLVAGTDYNTSTANTIAGLAALANGDVIEVVVYDIFTVADTVSSLNGGTFSNSVTIDKDGGTVLTVDRATDNGAVIDIQKDGTSVGSVQSRGGAVTSVIFDPRSNGAGMTGTTNAIMPTNQAGAIGDGTAVVDLGASGHRFRDMFLSGNIYLGGTGTANALSDYEEGTVSSISDGSGAGLSLSFNSGRYRKIGDIVNYELDFQFPATGDTSQNTVTCLPFNPAVHGSGTIGYTTYNAGIIVLALDTSNNIKFYNLAGAGLSNSSLSNVRFIINFTYQTNS